MIVIREAEQEDYLDIAHIHFTSWDAAYQSLLPKSYMAQHNNLSDKIELWQKIIVHPDVKVWIAYIAHDNDKRDKPVKVGFLGCFNKEQDYEITTLYVLPDYQGLGIGSQLMQVAVEAIQNSTANFSLSLWVLEDNLSAIEFYKKQGFVISKESSEELQGNTKIVDIKMIKALQHL